jgi:hypothetical protein
MIVGRGRSMNNLKDLLEIAFKARDADCLRFWNTFTVMTLMNGALLAFVGTHLDQASFAILISIMGAVVCLVWLQMQKRYVHWVEHWETNLRELERHIKEEIDAGRRRYGLSEIASRVDLFLTGGRAPRDVGSSAP